MIAIDECILIEVDKMILLGYKEICLQLLVFKQSQSIALTDLQVPKIHKSPFLVNPILNHLCMLKCIRGKRHAVIIVS